MLSTSSVVSAASNDVTQLCERHISNVARAENVPIGLLYAVALTETGVGGQLSPYALNVEGKSFIGKTRTEALQAFRVALGEGKTLIDVGCMQVNYRYHQAQFARVEDMFDPRLNVIYAAKLLASLKRKHGTWMNAVARYHAGPKNKAAQHRYTCKVLEYLVTTGFGRWTPESRSYCGSLAR